MSNDKVNLTDWYGYSKKIVTDKNQKETMLIKHIQQICKDIGYVLVEIKIKKNDTL